MKHILIFILPLAFILTSCGFADPDSSTNIEPIDFTEFAQDLENLSGTWVWSRSILWSVPDKRYGQITPQITGDTQNLFISVEEDIVERFKNGELSWSRDLEDYLKNKVWGIKDDTLVVSAMHRDGFKETFTRTKPEQH